MVKGLKFAVIMAAAVAGSGLAVEANATSLDRHIILVNRSHETIAEFHASNVGSRSWEEDILGDSVLLPGQSVRINLSDGSGYCRFDFKTVTGDGDAIVRRGVNVCELETYTITN